MIYALLILGPIIAFVAFVKIVNAIAARFSL
jgi:hypothetical protein